MSTGALITQEVEKVPRTYDHHFAVPQHAAEQLRRHIEKADRLPLPIQAMQWLESAVPVVGEAANLLQGALVYKNAGDGGEIMRQLLAISGYRYDVRFILRRLKRGEEGPKAVARLLTCPPLYRRLRYHDLAVCELYAALGIHSYLLQNFKLAETYVRLSIKGAYHDWVLRRKLASREFCVASIYRLGSWLAQRGDYHKASPLLLFATLSSNASDRRQAALSLKNGADPAVAFFAKIIEHGPDGHGERIRHLCSTVFQCCPAVMWFSTAWRSPFVEWFIDQTPGYAFAATWPWTGKEDRDRIAAEIAEILQDDGTVFSKLLTSLDHATRCLRPYDPEIQDIMTKLAIVHEKSGRHQLQLICLRRSLEIARRRHAITHPGPNQWSEDLLDIMAQIVRAKTSLCLERKNDHSLATAVLDLARSIIDKIDRPYLRLCMALACAILGNHGTAWFHWGEFEQTSCDKIEENWQQRVRALLKEKDFTTGTVPVA